MDRRAILIASCLIVCAFFYGWSFGLDTTGRAIQFVYYTDKHSWNEARNVCRSIGGELARVDSQQTIDDIKQLALDGYPGENFLSTDFWIGLYDASTTRREFTIDCSELTFTSNFIEEYQDNERCFKLKPNSDMVGSSRPCDEDNPFLCEIHLAGTCSFRYEMTNVSAVDVSGVNGYGVCEDHCAYDLTCSGALFISPSVCYKLPYNTSNVTSPALATVSSKFCLTFLKNETVVLPWENKEKYPVDNCSIIPNSGLGNLPSAAPTSSIVPTSSIAQTSTMIIEPPCSTLMMTKLVTSPCLCTASASPLIATITEVQMTTIQTSTSPCVCTASPETTTTVLTLTATATATEVQMTTLEITQQCSTQTHISPVTVQVTATPSCLSHVTPSVTTQRAHIITIQEAEKVAEELSRNLTVNVKKTSAYLRSLISVPDNRKTSQAMGSVGIACIVVPLGIIISSDLKLIYIYLRGLLS